MSAPDGKRGHIEVGPELHDELVVLAEQRGLHLNIFVRMLLRETIDRHLLPRAEFRIARTPEEQAEHDRGAT